MTRALWRLWWRLRAAASRPALGSGRFPKFSLRDTRGRTHALSAGRPAVLWFTNLCEDCLARIPLLEELRRSRGNEVQVLAVSVLGAERTLPEKAQALCGFPVLLDPDDFTANRLGLAHPPAACPLRNLFVLDASLRVVFQHHLSALSPRALQDAVARAVRGGEPGGAS